VCPKTNVQQSERCEPSELRESQLPNWPLRQRTSLVSRAADWDGASISERQRAWEGGGRTNQR
jgi:hypothetical protein